MNKQSILAGILALILIGALGFIFIQKNKQQDSMQNDIANNVPQEEQTEGVAEEQTATTTSNVDIKNFSQAVFVTNQGQFTLSLELEKAPKTTANFIKLAQDGFYNGQRFHRVIEGFMIQGGDPNSKDVNKKALWGTGDPGYKFADEFGQGLSNVTGTISMANAGPNTNGSQFFINTNDNTFLDGKHAVFGKVTEGMDIVMKISKVDTDPTDKPLSDVVIEKVEIK